MTNIQQLLVFAETMAKYELKANDLLFLLKFYQYYNDSECSDSFEVIAKKLRMTETVTYKHIKVLHSKRLICMRSQKGTKTKVYFINYNKLNGNESE